MIHGARFAHRIRQRSFELTPKPGEEDGTHDTGRHKIPYAANQKNDKSDKCTMIMIFSFSLLFLHPTIHP